MMGEMPMAQQLMAQPGFSLEQIIVIVRANLKRSAVIAACIIVIAAGLIKILPKTYESTATLLVNYQINDPLSGQEFPLGLLDSYMSTQIELMQSPDVLFPVIEKLNLANNEQYTAGYKGDGTNRTDWVRAVLSKALTIDRGNNQLIRITAASDNPVEAADIANSVAESYLAAHRKRLAGPAAERAKRYTEMLADLKHKVELSQDKVTSFRQKAGITDITNDAQGNLILATMEQRLLEARNARRLAEANASGNQTVSNQVIASNLVQGLKTQLAQKRSELAKLETTLGPQHPQIMQLKSEITATERSLSTQITSYTDNATSELAAAKLLEQKLQKAVDEQRTKTLAVRGIQDDGAKYLVELESAQAVYKKALDGYDQTMIASGGEYTNVNLVDHAVIPLKASKPNKPKYLALAVAIGALFGLVIPFVLELLNRKVRCRDDIERELGIPVLAEFDAIPVAETNGTAT
ncbi:MAG: GumC family protein [Steroidobacteraceae bacterium]